MSHPSMKNNFLRLAPVAHPTAFCCDTKQLVVNNHLGVKQVTAGLAYL